MRSPTPFLARWGNPRSDRVFLRRILFVTDVENVAPVAVFVEIVVEEFLFCGGDGVVVEMLFV